MEQKERLLENLRTYFNESELRDICYRLIVDYETLSGTSKADKTRELITYLDRHQRLPDLLEIASRLRPGVSWYGAPGVSDNLITRSAHVPIFTKGQSLLTTTMVSNALIIDFNNDQTWSGIAFVFTPKLDVQEFTHLEISCIATRPFTFQIEYKIRATSGLEIVTSSSFQSFPATMLVSTIKIPLRYDGKVNEITLMFYELCEASQVTIESIRLSR